MLQAVTKRGARAAAVRHLTLHGRCSVSSAALDARWSRSQWQQSSSNKRNHLMAIGALAAAGVGVMSFGAKTQCEANAEERRSGYAVNPIQNVTALIRLYEEIDKNMEVLTNRMLADLKMRVDKVCEWMSVVDECMGAYAIKYTEDECVLYAARITGKGGERREAEAVAAAARAQHEH